MAKYSWYWRPIDVETGEPICKGECFGSKYAALEGLLFTGAKVMPTGQEYRPKGSTEWRKYAIKRVKREV